MQDGFLIKMGPKKKDVIISVSFTSIRFCRALCLALHVCMAMVVVPVWSANGVIKKYETESRRQERAVAQRMESDRLHITGKPDSYHQHSITVI